MCEKPLIYRERLEAGGPFSMVALIPMFRQTNQLKFKLPEQKPSALFFVFQKKSSTETSSTAAPVLTSSAPASLTLATCAWLPPCSAFCNAAGWFCWSLQAVDCFWNTLRATERALGRSFARRTWRISAPKSQRSSCLCEATTKMISLRKASAQTEICRLSVWHFFSPPLQN